MIIIAIIILYLSIGTAAQDAVLTPSGRFFLQLNELATYHHTFLVEIEA